MKNGISEMRKVSVEVSSAMRFTNSSLVMRKASIAPRDGRKMMVLTRGNTGSSMSPFSPLRPPLWPRGQRAEGYRMMRYPMTTTAPRKIDSA
jgi:hypothetical protein